MLMRNNAFTLIELAIVLVIIGLLVSVGVSLLPGLINQQKYIQNQNLIKKDYNTIIGYIMANGSLPLALSNTNGTASNNQNIGYLPYQTLGALPKDAYGNTFYYALNNRSLNISIDNSTTTLHNINLANTKNLPNFCAVLYGLNYYYTNNPQVNSSDTRVENTANQSNPTKVVFVLISSGADNKLNSPNSITNPTGLFASEQYPLSQNYDDVTDALTINNAIGQFCANYQYDEGSCSGTTCNLKSNNPSSSAPASNGTSNLGQCISNCETNFFCYINAIINYDSCSKACKQNPNFCQ